LFQAAKKAGNPYIKIKTRRFCRTITSKQQRSAAGEALRGCARTAASKGKLCALAQGLPAVAEMVCVAAQGLSGTGGILCAAAQGLSAIRGMLCAVAQALPGTRGMLCVVA